MTASMTAVRPSLASGRIARALRAAALALVVGACSDEGLNQPNLNTPSPDGVDANITTGVQLRATGILALARDQMAAFVSDVGILGRESYNYTPTESRNSTDYLGTNASQGNGFNAGAWAGRYRNMRNARDLIALAERTQNNTLTTAERAAVRGFANTMWALELYHVIVSRDTLGAPLDIVDRNDSAAVFVRRDSVYRFILSKLDAARTDLLAGGGAFPFPLHSGFTGFNTPATFAQFNRGLHARVASHAASLGIGGTTLYTAAVTSLGQSFLDAGAAADLTRGVYHVYSTASGDNLNAVSPQVSPDQLAHPSVETDLQAGDTRFAAKVRRLAAPRTGPQLATFTTIATSLQYTIYPTNITPIPVIRNEELILLRAEALYFTGNQGGALADINYIRGRAGLPARGSFTGNGDFLNELLYQRRYSLMFEGHRWVDARRFGRLTSLPLDTPNHVRQPWQPIPQAECDARALIIRRIGAAANQPFTGLAAPSCPGVAL
jgi:hypothetical protein